MRAYIQVEGFIFKTQVDIITVLGYASLPFTTNSEVILIKVISNINVMPLTICAKDQKDKQEDSTMISVNLTQKHVKELFSHTVWFY